MEAGVIVIQGQWKRTLKPLFRVKGFVVVIFVKGVYRGTIDTVTIKAR